MKKGKSEEEWKTVLTDEQYKILREKGTEPAFSGQLLDNKKQGIYTCSACGEPLFSAETKFDSGSGWPSFYATMDNNNIEEKLDKSQGMIRTEVLCSSCGGHLGHLFPDGPNPSGMRYCINSASLDFDPDKE